LKPTNIRNENILIKLFINPRMHKGSRKHSSLGN